MKKKTVFLICLTFFCTHGYSQKFFKTSTPCNTELLKKTPGRWMDVRKIYPTKVSKQLEQEIEKRLYTIHQWVYDIYPSPMAFDVTPFYSHEDIDFGAQLTINKTDKGLAPGPLENGIPVVRYGYSAAFCDYHCGRDVYEIMRGAGCEAPTYINAEVNSLSPLFSALTLDDFYADIMRIEGRPIKMMHVLVGKWKDYDLYAPEPGSGIRSVLLHREGMLPYIPVTRKQYLDRSIACLEKFFNNNIKAIKNPEGLNQLMDKKEREEQIKKQQKFRDNVMKFYKDEVDATTKAGLLNDPAIVAGGVIELNTSGSIFSTQAKGGNLLVTENPAYMKKDLPKYIPQLIIYVMWDGGRGPDPAVNPYKIFEDRFPIEKLQAMIDK